MNLLNDVLLDMLFVVSYYGTLVAQMRVTRLSIFLARRDKCLESYCRTPSVGVGVRMRVHKNFNLAYNS